MPLYIPNPNENKQRRIINACALSIGPRGTDIIQSRKSARDQCSQARTVNSDQRPANAARARTWHFYMRRSSVYIYIGACVSDEERITRSTSSRERDYTLLVQLAVRPPIREFMPTLRLPLLLLLRCYSSCSSSSSRGLT